MLAVALLLLAGCSSRNPATATVPAITGVPSPADTAQTANPSVAPQQPQEPSLGVERVVVPALKPGEVVRQQPADEPQVLRNPSVEPIKTQRRYPASPAQRSPETGQPAEAEPARAEQRPPSLKPMLSDAERRQLEQQAQGNLDRARRNLASIQESRLPATERTVLQEARSFVARAEQLLESDVPLANSLAERAAILTQELLRKQR